MTILSYFVTLFLIPVTKSILPPSHDDDLVLVNARSASKFLSSTSFKHTLLGHVFNLISSLLKQEWPTNNAKHTKNSELWNTPVHLRNSLQF